MRGLWALSSVIFFGSLLSGCFLIPDPFDDNRGESCRTNSECDDGLRCGAGVCVTPGAAGLAGACWANADCDSGLFCSRQGLCGPEGDGGIGAPCGTGAECTDDLYCENFGLSGSCQTAGDADVGESCAEIGDCLAGLICNPNETCEHPLDAFPAFEGVDCAPDGETFRAFFEVPRTSQPLADFFRLPFPSDIRDNGDGTLNLSDFPVPGPGLLGVDLVGLYVEAFARDFRGFSSIAPVSFRFSGPVNFTTLTPASIHYIDVTPGADELGSDRSRSWKFSTTRGLYNCQNFLTIQNNVRAPLLPGHTYAAYLTTDIRSESGDIPEQDADLAALLNNSAPGDTQLASAHAVFAPFRNYIASQIDLAPSDIAGATVFTVADSAGRTRELVEAATATPAPVLTDVTLCDGTNASPCEDASGRGACGSVSEDFHEVHGRFTVPIFQVGTAPYEVPTDGGVILSPPTVQRTEEVCFALTIPKASTPVGGFPTVVYAHGTSGTFRGVVDNGVAEALATAPTPMAVFSYDGIAHGDRRGESSQEPDALVFNVVNPLAARDNNLQGAVDVAQALRVPELGTIAVTGVGDVQLNGTKTYFFGHSQGATVGMPAIVTQNRAPAAIFSGAGSYLTRALLTKSNPVDTRAGLEFLVGETLSDQHPVMVLWQNFFDQAETLNYAPLLLQRPLEGVDSKHVVVTWGEVDTFSPNATINATAYAAQLPVANTVREPLYDESEPDNFFATRPVSLNFAAGDGVNRTAALFQYTSAGFDGHFVAQRNTTAVADWLGFLQSLANTAIPVIP